MSAATSRDALKEALSRGKFLLDDANLHHEQIVRMGVATFGPIFTAAEQTDALMARIGELSEALRRVSCNRPDLYGAPELIARAALNNAEGI